MVKKTKSSEKWGQSLASAIVTPNPFVILNEILDEISIALSSTSSKMDQDQPLAVLSNVVFSGRLLPVLEAKQFPPVGSPVFGNWADQMETNSSPPLVFGATSGVASTLVPGATFKIKLAHVKAVFQSVHGFLGAKSVSKNNVKLFCMEFAFQQSLKAVFLVELTSSVHLATLKIAKSLVVSKSGSSPATVVLCNVPLGVSTADIKTALGVFGKVVHVVLKPVGVWQYMVVYFKELDAAAAALNYWSILVGKDSVKILPVINQNEAILSHDRFKAKLSSDSGHCFWFALVIFDFQDNLNSAVVKTGTLRKCHICCQEIDHLAVDYKVFSSPTSKVPKVFKSYFVGSASYAKTAAPFSLSEFPSLVAPSVASAVDPAVGSRLDSLEKQISDLAALVKSIVELVGSLVALVFHFLDDNAVKTV
ncbi:hypothetical protein G9A89_023956 [Geosiphon pyriformis]|nr:hypothetical protein G9A89_023956 [Geosiphon pyriformis]